eukprot:4415762-Amphidinium_carterae.1
MCTRPRETVYNIKAGGTIMLAKFAATKRFETELVWGARVILVGRCVPRRGSFFVGSEPKTVPPPPPQKFPRTKR